MGLSRSELREKAMVILYQVDIMKANNINFNVEELINENLDIDNEFVRDLVYGVTTHLTEIDELANKNMKNWTIDRIDKTGAQILRIAKKYSDDDVRKIINAVLDKVNKEN